MRDPDRRADPNVEAAIELAVTRLRPFLPWKSDAPLHKILKELETIGAVVDDGRRHSIGEWRKRFRLAPPVKVTGVRGHPSYRFFRRQVILLVLDELTALGFRPRRNQLNYDDHHKRQSGCSIVSAALYRLRHGMPEAAVVDLIRPSRRKT